METNIMEPTLPEDRQSQPNRLSVIGWPLGSDDTAQFTTCCIEYLSANNMVQCMRLQNITYIPHPSTLVIAPEEVTRVSTICHCHCSYTLFEKVTYFFYICQWMRPFPKAANLPSWFKSSVKVCPPHPRVKIAIRSALHLLKRKNGIEHGLLRELILHTW